MISPDLQKVCIWNVMCEEHVVYEVSAPLFFIWKKSWLHMSRSNPEAVLTTPVTKNFTLYFCLIWQISLWNCALCSVDVVIMRKPSLSFKLSWNSVFSDHLFSALVHLTKMLLTSCRSTGTAMRQNLVKTLVVAGQFGWKLEGSRPPVSFGTAKVCTMCCIIDS